MSLIEIIGESLNPGPVGEVKFKREPDSPKNKYLLLHFSIAVVTLLAGEYTYLHYANVGPMNLDFWIFNGILSIYLVCGYYINITPETSNLGWVPFIIDNPFRFSDDFNRFSIFIMIILFPGKYVSSSLVRYYRYKKNTN
jgi:hypothetical protein